MQTFNNLEEVFHFYGAESEKELDRRIYKSTPFGGWASTIKPGPKLGEVEETWTACLAKSIGGVAILSTRKRGERKLRAEQTPKRVLEHLLAKPDNPRRSELTCTELENLTVGEDVTRITRRGPLVFYVTFKVKIPRKVGEHQGALVLGTIVEGSTYDPCIEPQELWFPFTEGELDRALEYLDGESDRLWHEFNEA